jgi:hypothetical protein
MNHEDLQNAVLDLSKRCGWDHYHPYDSRRSVPGWPDLTLVRPPRLIFAELKIPPDRPTPAQARWLTLLAQIPGAEVYLWEPEHLGIIGTILSPRYFTPRDLPPQTFPPRYPPGLYPLPPEPEQTE